MSRRRNRSRSQQKLRTRRGESAFVFDPTLSSCLGRVDREDWELEIDFHGGDVVLAAAACGVGSVPRGSKALWGRSAEEARATYQRWQAKKKRR